MAILDIRGTHGSGKSWLVHQLLAKYPHTPVLEHGTHLGYALGKVNSVVIGKYGTVCGGCDGIGTADEVVRRVRLFAKRQYRHVILEGILVSHTFKRYSDLAGELKDYRFLFLNTPLRNCIARVMARRHQQGNTKPLNPKNIIKDHYGVYTRVRNQVIAAGQKAVVLDWKDPLKQLTAILEDKP